MKIKLDTMITMMYSVIKSERQTKTKNQTPGPDNQAGELKREDET